MLPSLKLTAKAPENGWLEYYFLIGGGLFSVAMLVSGSVFVLKLGSKEHPQNPQSYFQSYPFFSLFLQNAKLHSHVTGGVILQLKPGCETLFKQGVQVQVQLLATTMLWSILLLLSCIARTKHKVCTSRFTLLSK